MSIHLGFAARSLLRPNLAGGRSSGRLSVDLARLGDMVGHLVRVGVRFYRPALSLPAGGHAELTACAGQLAALAEQLAAAGVRLSLHLNFGLGLGGGDDALAARGLASVELAAALLARLEPPGASPRHSMVVHLGGGAGDREAGERFAARYRSLSAAARRRLSLEHDTHHSLGELLRIHQRCGVAVVFDALHHELYNPEGLGPALGLGLALATWPAGMRPEAHLSSARSEGRIVAGRAGAGPAVLPPHPGQHADFVLAGDLERLLRAASGLPPFDLMLEAGASDMALQRLRHELAARAPGLSARLG